MNIFASTFITLGNILFYSSSSTINTCFYSVGLISLVVFETYMSNAGVDLEDMSAPTGWLCITTYVRYYLASLVFCYLHICIYKFLIRPTGQTDLWMILGTCSHEFFVLYILSSQCFPNLIFISLPKECFTLQSISGEMNMFLYIDRRELCLIIRNSSSFLSLAITYVRRGVPPPPKPPPPLISRPDSGHSYYTRRSRTASSTSARTTTATTTASPTPTSGPTSPRRTGG